MGWLIALSSGLAVLLLPLGLMRSQSWLWLACRLRRGTEETCALAGEVLRRMQARADGMLLVDLRRADGALLLSPREVVHLLDVQAILSLLVSAQLVLSVLLIGLMLLGRRSDRLRRALRRGGWLAIAAIVLPLLGAAANFRSFWAEFHHWIFVPGSWAFSGSSGLIQMYPMGFWQLSIGAYGALVVVSGCSLITISR